MKAMSGGRDPRATAEFLRSTLGHGEAAGGQESGLHIFATYLFTHNSRISILFFRAGLCIRRADDDARDHQGIGTRRDARGLLCPRG